jgi:hypothetical protein
LETPYGLIGFKGWVSGTGWRATLPSRHVAVDGPAGGGEDDLLTAGRNRRPRHVHGAEHVDLGVPKRIRGGARDQRLRGEMEDDARRKPPPNLHHVLTVADVGFDEVGARIDVDARAGREVIDDADPVTFSQQRVDEMRPDEACAAGDHRAHQ